MSEKSGYGAQIFILIVAIVLLASLSRISHISGRYESPPRQHELSHVQDDAGRK